MVIYEVNLWVQAEIAPEYRAWLASHMEELLALPGFVRARLLEVCDPPPQAGEVALCVHYQLESRAALDAYLTQHAARLREQGMRRFGGRFRAARRVLHDPMHDDPTHGATSG